jgi:hypothetical protein
MNNDTRSALHRALTDVENAAVILPGEEDDDSLLRGEIRQIQSWTLRLNDIAGSMRNMVDRADRRDKSGDRT